MIKKSFFLSLAFFVLALTAPSVFASVNILIQPQNQTVQASSNAVFTAATSTSSGETITGYTWLFSTNSGGPFTPVSGAITANLTIPNAQLPNSGFYFVRVNYQTTGGGSGISVSTLASLTVLDQARITVQPVGGFRAVGTTFSFNAAAAGQGPLGYRWRFNGAALSDNARVTGTTSNILTITTLSTNDTGNYILIVTNSYSATTSQVATLTVLFPPAIIAQPTNVATLTGSNILLSATLDGSAPFYFQWRKGGTNLTNNARVSGATNATLQIVNAITNDTSIYSLLVTNPVGSTTSVEVTVNVYAPPVFTNLSSVIGQQGVQFTHSLAASGSMPITFSAAGLPAGLSLNPTNGLISGVPLVSGSFEVDVFAANAGVTTAGKLFITLTTGIPGITSPLSRNLKQGQTFNYTIAASNAPTSFSATGLPAGLNLNALTGVISGVSIESGVFPVTISAINQFGAGSQVLQLNIASAIPVVIPPLTANGAEGDPNFNYLIRATNNPTSFGATGLPPGLTVNTNTGRITGAPAYGGTNNVLIFARNAWGVGTNTLRLQIAFTPVMNLFITDLTSTYSKPYLLDFTFSLRTDRDPAVGQAVVREPGQITVIAKEGNTNTRTVTPIGNETGYVLSRGLTSNAKQLKTFFTLDYTYSLFAAHAIDALQAAVTNLINQEPGSAQFAVNEFHADFIAPKLVADFTSDKVLLANAIAGIQTNFVQGNYAGSRLYDALNDALTKFGAANTDEQRYLIVMSDGYDDSSVLTPPAPDKIVNAATNARVQIYCVGFGTNVNTVVLQDLADRTGGRYFAAANTNEIATQFTLLLKDLNAQYFLRWATLQRGPSFQPMFDVIVDGVRTSYNTNFPVTLIDKTVTPPVTNTVKIDTTYTPPRTNMLDAYVPDFDPTTWSNNVQVGSLRLVGDSVSNLSSITLRAFYTPRYVREFRLHYRANYPCAPVLLSTKTNEILFGWSLSQSNDGAGGQWLTIASPDPTNVFTSLPYGIRGDLISFQFQHQAVPSGQQAFSLFEIDNTVYTNLPPSGQSFVLENTNLFVMIYPAPPPFGTPVPWLLAHGFSNNLAAAELSDPTGKGLPVWQQYLAGLDPNDPNSVFVIRTSFLPQMVPPYQITFSTVAGKIYRVETATTLGLWTTLEDNISGTGGNVSVVDGRNLSGVSAVFYRIAVY